LLKPQLLKQTPGHLETLNGPNVELLRTLLEASAGVKVQSSVFKHVKLAEVHSPDVVESSHS